MIIRRKSNERGKAKYSWLSALYSFSFGSYFDPAWMGYRNLKVINEDIIDEGGGFETHPHSNMEILSFVLSGQLEHKDTLGNHCVIVPGEIQIISAGSGIEHSEFNPSENQKTHMLQIWMEPNSLNCDSRYEQYKYPQTENDFVLIASYDGGVNIAKINQDINIYHAIMVNHKMTKIIKSDRYAWIQVTSGRGFVNGVSVEQGDGVAIDSESLLEFETQTNLKFLLFDLC